jgi:LacI family transcriptional regulator
MSKAVRNKTQSPQRVVLAFPYGRAFVENVIEGILDYAHREANWQITRFPERLSPSLDWLRGWEGDGAFVILASREDARVARALPFPVVNITAYFPRSGVTTVTADHREIGRVAALHLLERRFRKFGYYGSKELFFSQTRRDGFMATVREHGARCALLEVSANVTSARVWMRQQAELERWLRALRPPVAIMASTDLRAGMLLDSCRRLGLRVPDDVAVIGVDNDPVVVARSQPPLTSVARNDRQAGELAAQQLAALMAGQPDRRELILVPPAGVVARQSTETLAVEDPALAALVQHVRENLGEKFGVERLLKLTQWSRRSLENHFRQHLGVSPYTLINQLRVDQARRILETRPKEPLAQVAAACGFSDVRHLRLVFRRMLKKSPSEYRRRLG